MDEPVGASRTSFDEFVASVGARVRRALVAFYGVEVGTEAAADAMSVAWERWNTVAAMDNPSGYLFRIGQSRARPHVRWARRRETFPTSGPLATAGDADAVIDLLDALRDLKPAQRTAVVMVKSYGFSYREVAEVLGISTAAVTNHVHRGLERLRSRLEQR